MRVTGQMIVEPPYPPYAPQIPLRECSVYAGRHRHSMLHGSAKLQRSNCLKQEASLQTIKDGGGGSQQGENIEDGPTSRKSTGSS